MDTTPELEVDQILEQFRHGQLTDQTLRQALERRPVPKHQDLLYLETSNSSLIGGVLGMTLVCDGQIVAPVTGAATWPYANVLEAIRDGWRVIKFPELALLLNEERTIGLG